MIDVTHGIPAHDVTRRRAGAAQRDRLPAARASTSPWSTPASGRPAARWRCAARTATCSSAPTTGCCGRPRGVRRCRRGRRHRREPLPAASRCPHTFHGRDLFAPVAAAPRARASALESAGKPIAVSGIARRSSCRRRSSEGDGRSPRSWRVDRFGNLQLHLGAGGARGGRASARQALEVRRRRAVRSEAICGSVFRRRAARARRSCSSDSSGHDRGGGQPGPRRRGAGRGSPARACGCGRGRPLRPRPAPARSAGRSCTCGGRARPTTRRARLARAGARAGTRGGRRGAGPPAVGARAATWSAPRGPVADALRVARIAAGRACAAAAGRPRVAVCEACEAVAPVACRIKWPNDVWIDGRKVAGILIEARPQEGWAVIGIGLNVNADAPRISAPSCATPPPRCGSPSGRPVSREAALDALFDRLADRLADLESGRAAELLDRYRERDVLDRQARSPGPQRVAAREGQARRNRRPRQPGGRSPDGERRDPRRRARCTWCAVAGRTCLPLRVDR